jgi:quercetin dioxygenase-like cupin family protein
MRHPYLFDLNNPDHWLYPIELIGPDGVKGEDQRTIHMPQGQDRLFCVTDSVMYPAPPGNKDLHFHEHQRGWEDFFVDSGGLYLYINGKKAHVAPGDIIHLQPYEAHGMDFDAPTKYRGFMHGIANSDNSPELAVLRANKGPDVMQDPAFPREKLGHSDYYPRETPLWEEVPPEQCSPIRNIRRPMAEFKLDGVTMKMIVARWENGGLIEMWAAEMDKGFKAKSIKFPTHLEMYYVTAGSVKFTVLGEEFTAGPECVVRVPKLAEFTIEALADSVVYDVGGLPRWYAYLQDRASILANDPARAKDPAVFASLREKFDIQLEIAPR